MNEAVEVGERRDREDLHYPRPEHQTQGENETRGMEWKSTPLRPHVRGREFGVKARWQVKASSEGTPIWLRSHKRKGAGRNRKRL